MYLPSVRLLINGLVTVALVILFLSVAMFIQHAYKSVGFIYQMDYGEGVEVYMVSRLVNHQALYSDIHHPPYHLGVYPPLYPLIVAALTTLTGSVYGAGRAASVLFSLAIAWLLGRMVYEESQIAWAGLVTGLLWLASPLVYTWAILMRVDMLAIALSMLGLYCFWRGYVRLGKQHYVYVAMAAFVGAAYARQTSIWAAASCLISLALARRWRLLGESFSLYAGLGLAIFIAIEIVTEGQFYRHLVTYNLPIWSLARWQAGLGRLWVIYPVAILASLSTLVLALQRRWPSLPALYLIFGFVSTATIGTIGAYVNHLLEANAALCLTSGLLLGRAAGSRRPGWLLLASAALVLQVAMLVHFPYSLGDGVLRPWSAIPPAARVWFKEGRLPSQWTPSDADVKAADVLDARVRRAPGLILSEDGAFTTTHGRPMWIQLLDFALLSRFGIWDQTPFLNQIRNQRFALVLLKFDISRDVSSRNIVTAEMVEALRANYALEEKMWLYYVYVPRLASDR